MVDEVRPPIASPSEQIILCCLPILTGEGAYAIVKRILERKVTAGETDSRFKHKLYLVLLDNRDGPAIRAGRSLWALQRPMTYHAGDGDRIVVPAGFVTDLASIPRPVWSLYPPDGPWVKAAVVHDFLYDTQGDGAWGRRQGVQRNPPFTRRQSDDILMEGMIDRRIGWFQRHVIWAAVRLGGGGGWKRAGELRASRTALGRKAVPHPGPAVKATH